MRKWTMNFGAAVLGLLGLLAHGTANAQTAYAINNSDIRQLIRFDVTAPANVTIVGSLLADGVPIEVDALDFNLNDGKMYAYSYQYDEIFQVNPTNGVLTSVRGSNLFTHSPGLGFEFNPVNGGFRLINDYGDNFSYNTSWVGTANTRLAYAAGDPRAGTAPLVGDVAFANNIPGATSTTLYGIDYGTDSLVRIGGNPGTSDGTPNDPAAGRVFTVGALGFNTGDFVGFDIDSSRGAEVGYAILTPPTAENSPRLYRVNLTTGASTLVGNIGSTVALYGLTIQPPRLSGTVQFEGLTAPTGKTVTLTFKPTVGQPITVTRPLDAAGTFSLLGIPFGTYTLNASSVGFLARNAAVTVSGDTTNAGTLTLRAGDVNGDNFADITDLLALIAHYNAVSPSAEYLQAADFNADGSNDISDLLLLIGNFNAVGDSLP
jgi:hypothetical protein